MPTTRLSSKGQIIIPKTIRKTRSWEPGQEFDVIETDDGVLLRPHQAFPPTTFDDVEKNPLRYEGPPVPVEHMNGAYALKLEMERADDPDTHSHDSPK